ncbi:MAG: right-handed parallel beta-helix repeat-containing protein, partial [Bacteroidales bacterium]|nr:right-handed parallel beta-helix repeat-containing protein [Bacteroidales bacterium]
MRRFTILITMLLFIAASTATGQGQTRYVVTDCEGSVNSPCYESIQEAIDIADPGDVIEVAAGTFVEQILIQKNLTLVGAGAGLTIVQAPASAGACVAGISGEGLIGIGTNWTSDYLLAAYPTDWVGTAATGTPIQVKVTGFTFDANNTSHDCDRYTGVFFGCVKGATYSDAGLFESQVINFSTSDVSATGVCILGDSKLSVYDCIIQYTINGIAAYGDLSTAADPDVLMDDNELICLLNTLSGDEYALSVYFGATGTVSNNTVTDVAYYAVVVSSSNNVNITGNIIANQSHGIIYYNATGGTASGNNIDDGGTGIYLWNATLITVKGNTITDQLGNGITLNNSSGNFIGTDGAGNGNTITNFEVYGINVFGNNNVICNNTLSDLTGYSCAAGISIYDATGNNVLRNTLSNIKSGNVSSITNAAWAIVTWDNYGVAANNHIGDGTCANANIITNSDASIVFYGTGTGNTAKGNYLSNNLPFGLNNFGGAVIDATLNWWGASTGPTVTGNTCGTGDPLTNGTNVTYAPWYVDQAMTSTTTTTGYLVHNTTKGTYYCKIQAAIDAASEGDFIRVLGGVYSETVTIDKGVILSPGASPGCITVTDLNATTTGGTLLVEIDGPTACSGYDQVTVTGTATLTDIDLDIALGNAPTCTASYTILDVVGTLSSTFDGLTEGGVVTATYGGNTYSFTITYVGSNGNDVVLTYCENVPPVLTAPTPLVLDCDQSADYSTDIADWIGTASVTDACDQTITITNNYTGYTQSCGSVITVTFNATDDCSNTATPVTSTITFRDITAPVLTAPTPLELECDQLKDYSTDIADWIGTASVTDACDQTITITNNYTGYTQSCGSVITVTFNATDDCSNPASVTSTITFIDTELPVITTDAISGAIPGDCCNPDVITPTFTGLDNCDGVFSPTISTNGPINTKGCNWEQTWETNYTDACGNAATPVSITYTWIGDLEGPELHWMIPSIPTPIEVSWPGTLELGCNPDVLPACNLLVTASDDCVGSTAVDCAAGPISGTCQKTQTFTYTAEDLCCNVTTKTVTYTWKDDLIPPYFTGVPDDTDLGCNPTDMPDCAEWDVKADDECDGEVSPCLVICEAGVATKTSECDWTQTFLFEANDACDNVGTESATFTWRVDLTPPVLAGLPEDTDLGKCPDELPVCEDFVGVTATDVCGIATVTCDASVVTATDNCGMVGTLTFSFSAYDECNNVATPVGVVFTWIEDWTPPQFVGIPTATVDLACNPEPPDENTTVVTATDNCDGVVDWSCVPGPETFTGCQYTQTFVYTAVDACENTASATITYTWKEDLVAPVLAGVPDGGYLGCNPEVPMCDTFTVTATDNCDLAVSITCTPGTATETTNCHWTKTLTWYAEDACGNGVTETATFTWKEDKDKPIITLPPYTANLGCNPVQRGVPMPACDPLASAYDDCDGPLTPHCEVLDPEYDGCFVTQKVVYTATDICCNVGVATATYYWKEDTTPPVIGGVPDDEDLGCNPAEIPDCDDLMEIITAEDNCDDDLEDCCMDCTGVPITTTNCDWTVTYQFRAWDLCGNIGTESVTYTWRIDNDPPVIAGIPDTQPIDLGYCPELPT